jgi:cysteine desulfurase
MRSQETRSAADGIYLSPLVDFACFLLQASRSDAMASMVLRLTRPIGRLLAPQRVLRGAGDVLQRRSRCATVVTVCSGNPTTVDADRDGEGLGVQSTGEAKAPRAAYLDSQATTLLDPRVLDAMMPYYVERYGNPHSRTHQYGWEAESAVENARKQVADLIGADAKEIIFTSGATESNNMAIKGVARFYKEKKRHVITTQTEHKCVLDSCRYLETEGFKVTYLPVQKNGLIDLAQLEEAITPETALVSIMAVNNEIGVLQPLKDIGRLCRSKKVFFHTDAAQMVGKMPLSVDEANIDLMSISGHKLYGPKGIGALYVRRRPRVRLEPLINGGGQERGLRSGTLPHPLVVGAWEVADCRMGEKLALGCDSCDLFSSRRSLGPTLFRCSRWVSRVAARNQQRVFEFLPTRVIDLFVGMGAERLALSCVGIRESTVAACACPCACLCTH